MFNEFYGLTIDPFRLSPDPRFCYRHRYFARAKAYMQYGLHQGEGFVMVTGQPGTGKTMLIEDLLADPGTTNVMIARIASTQVAGDDLLRLVAHAFDIDTHNCPKATTLLNLQTVLTRQMASGRNALLIVDEAQNLPYESLEELRMITNLQRGARPLMQVFLVGQDSLHTLVSQPRMEQLRQRILAACRMEPLSLDDTREYLQHRLRRAGWEGRPSLSGEAVWQIHAASGGIPRRINTLTSRLLLRGYIEERLALGADDVLLVTADLAGERLIGNRAPPDASPNVQMTPDPSLDLGPLAIEMPTTASAVLVQPVAPAEAEPPAPPPEPEHRAADAGDAMPLVPPSAPEAPALQPAPRAAPSAAQGPEVVPPIPPVEPSPPADQARPHPVPPTDPRQQRELGAVSEDGGAPSAQVKIPVETPGVPEWFAQPDHAARPSTRNEPVIDGPLPPLGKDGPVPALPIAPAMIPASGPSATGAGDETTRASPEQAEPAFRSPTRRGRRVWAWVAAAAVLTAVATLAALAVRPEWIGQPLGELQPIVKGIGALGAKARAAMADVGLLLKAARPDPAPVPPDRPRLPEGPAASSEPGAGPIQAGVRSTPSPVPSASNLSGPGASEPDPSDQPLSPLSPPAPGEIASHRAPGPAVPDADTRGLTPMDGGVAGMVPPTGQAAPDATASSIGEAEVPVRLPTAIPHAPQEVRSEAPPEAATADTRDKPSSEQPDHPVLAITDRQPIESAPGAPKDTPATQTPAAAPATSPKVAVDALPRRPETQADAGEQDSPAMATPAKGPAASPDAASAPAQPALTGATAVGGAEDDLARLVSRLVGLGFRPQPTDGQEIKLVLAREVAFGAGSAEMTPQAREAIAGLTQELAGHPLLRFTVVGHTDDSGPSDYNAALSLLRARAFAATLTEGGVLPEQITSEGRGETEPLTGKVMDGIPAHLTNRRIEVYIRDASLP